MFTPKWLHLYLLPTPHTHNSVWSVFKEEQQNFSSFKRRQGNAAAALSEVGEVVGSLLLQQAHGGIHQQVEAPELLPMRGWRGRRREGGAAAVVVLVPPAPAGAGGQGGRGEKEGGLFGHVQRLVEVHVQRTRGRGGGGTAD